MEIFRRQSLDHKRRRLHGEVMLTQPMAFMVLTLTVTAIVVAGVIYLASGSFARKETVAGWLAPDKGLAQSYAARGGRVTRLHVAQGDRVEKDAPLVSVGLEMAGAGGSVSDREQIEMRARLEEAEARLAAAESRYDSEEARLKEHLEHSGEEIDAMRASRGLQQEMTRLAERQWKRVKSLAETDAASGLEVDRARQAWISERAALAELDRTINRAEAELHESRHDLAIMPEQRTEYLSDLRSQASALRASLAELELSEGYVIRAPVSGVVASVSVKPGAPARPQQPLVSIIPDGSELQAHLLVPSRASGFLEMGQEVRLRYDAFPYQRFGFGEGRVTGISRTTYAPGQLAAPVPFEQSVYRVAVRLDAQTVEAYGAEHPLQPGMTIQGDLVLDRRPLLAWALDPLLAARGG